MAHHKKHIVSKKKIYSLGSLLLFLLIYLGGLLFLPDSDEITDEAVSIALGGVSSEFDQEVLGESTSVLEPVEMVLPVVAIVDGDTIKVQRDDELHTVRLLGIDTPETKAPGQPIECFGPEATEELENLVQARDVLLVPDLTQSNLDRYGRALRFVYLPNGFDVNSHMVEKGFAKVYLKEETKFHTELTTLEEHAKLMKVGLWGSCEL